MKSTIKILSLCVLLSSNLVAQAQIKFSEITNWLGDGKDSMTVVINFVNGEKDSCSAWGCLFNDSISGGQAFDLIALNDPNFSFVIGGGFLESISYKNKTYLNDDGGSKIYWNTFNWDGAKWNFNSGMNAMNYAGDQFGASYTGSDENWELYHYPVLAVAVPDPLSFTFDDVQWWVGSGTDSSVLIIDFQDGNKAQAWGFLHDGTKTGLEMLMAIDAAETYLEVYAGSFLDSIKFHNKVGINGDKGFYWGTWTATNMNNWSSNSGITTVLKNGDFFGTSYTNFNPALLPGVPEAVTNSTGINESVSSNLTVYPNPTKDILNIDASTIKGDFQVEVFDMQGKLVASFINTHQLDVSGFEVGVYAIKVQVENSSYHSRFIKK